MSDLIEDTSLNSLDPKFAEDISSLAVVEIEYPKIEVYFQSLLAGFWTHDEVPLSKDRLDWETKLTDGAKRALTYILAFFATADGIIMQNVNCDLSEMFDCCMQIKHYLTTQASNEVIHARTYMDLLHTIFNSRTEFTQVMRMIYSCPEIASMNKFAKKYMGKDNRDGIKLLANLVVEGIFFSGAFAYIYWIDEQFNGAMKGLIFSNEKIAPDELIHTYAAMELYIIRRDFPPLKDVHRIFKEGVRLAQDFARAAIPERMILMNNELMSTYIEFVADFYLKKLGYDPIYGAEQPFDFMDKISMDPKINFFETMNGQYGLAAKKQDLSSDPKIVEINTCLVF